MTIDDYNSRAERTRSSSSPGPLPVISRSGDGRLPVEEWDNTWSGITPSDRGVFEYYDYFFTGEDVKVFVEGVEPPDSDANIPIIEFAFKITQQKSPLYGFWSYTYDAMLRGTRIVNGVMRIATQNTGYMTRLLTKAAEARSSGKWDYVIRGLDSDEENIKRYWDNNIEPDKVQNQNIFSVHPPFNFVVIYGIDSLSACLAPSPKINQYVVDKYASGFGTTTSDMNHKIIEMDQEHNTMRRVIEGVEITDMQVEYSPNGQVCAELYSFLAKDTYSPKARKTNKVNYGNVDIPSAGGYQIGTAAVESNPEG